MLVYALLRYGFDVVEGESLSRNALGVRPSPDEDDLVPALTQRTCHYERANHVGQNVAVKEDEEAMLVALEGGLPFHFGQKGVPNGQPIPQLFVELC